MHSPLRAFLMVRSSNGEWTVDVCRELDHVLRVWREKSQGTVSTGVFHIGFDRSSAQKYEDLAKDHLGRVLVTASAKYALPVGYPSSTSAVGLVDDVPIFLALQGWGYEAPDVVHEEPPVVMADFQPTDWIKAYLELNPQYQDEFMRYHISDDAKYLEKEHELSWEVRRQSGGFRFKGKVFDDTDPCAIVNSSPPWLREREVSNLEMTVRVANCFKAQGIRYVRDLDKYTLNELLSFPNFGRKSVNDLVECLLNAIGVGPASNDIEQPLHAVSRMLAQTSELGLMGAIQASLQKYDERARDILVRRMGLGCSPQTLAEIGEAFGVTRERVRQIESKLLPKLRRDAVWDDVLSSKLQKLLTSREFPLPLHGVEAVDPWFFGIGHEPEVIKYVLANVCSGGASLVSIDGVIYLGFLSQEGWETAIREGRRLLTLGAEQGWPKQRCKMLVSGLLPQQATEFVELLWSKVSALCHFVDEAGTEVLKTYGRGAEQVVEAVLNEAVRPLHYSEIAELASSLAKRPIEIRRAHHAAAEVGLLLGRGVYGLQKHLPVTSAELEAISDQASDIVSEGRPGRQWHCAELLAMLLERNVVIPEGVDKYVLNVALKNSAELQELGRMVWKLGEDGVSDQARVDVREAVARIVTDAGRPLYGAEIRQRLVALRGVNQHLQISPGGPLIRIGPGLWGINDRDSVIKKRDQPRLANLLVQGLEKRGRGLHASELRAFLEPVPGLTVELLFSLATLDPRLGVGVGQFVYLKEWGGSRRETITDAVQALMLASASPLNLDQIVALLNQRLDREIPRSTVSRYLQILGAVYDPLADNWSMRDSSDEVAAEPPEVDDRKDADGMSAWE
jgi:hypothetical protein